MTHFFQNGAVLHGNFTPLLGRRYAGVPLGLWLVLGCFSVVFLAYANFVPMWDGWVYADQCILQGVRQPFSLDSFNCFGHPAMAYTLPIALLQYLDPGNVYFLHLVDWLLGILGIYSFYRISEHLFRGWARTIERVLLTGIFAFMPLFACNSINPNPDFGVIVFTLALFASLLWDRPVQQVLFGLGLVFCKETGVLIYTACVATFLLLNVPRPLGSVSAKFWHFLSRLHLAIPLAGFAYFIRAHMQSGAGWWGIHNPTDVLEAFRYVTSFALLDKTFLSYTYGALLNNFNWILSLFVIAYCVKWAWNRFWGTAHPVNRNQVLTFLVLLVIFFAVTRYQTHSNYRYIAVTGPLLALAAYWSMRRLFRRLEHRIALLSSVLVLIGISNWYSVDPLPKRIYGTFNFGKHEMLPIGLAMGDFAFPGLDELQYNFQYTHFSDAVDAIFTTIDPEKNLFVGGPSAGWSIVTRLQNSSHRRTLRLKDTVNANYIEMPELRGRSPKPETIHYIAFPNMGEAARDSDLEQLRSDYDVKETRRFGHGGYFIEVYTLARRAS